MTAGGEASSRRWKLLKWAVVSRRRDMADSGLEEEVGKLSPLLLHASSLYLQQQREEVLVVHGPRGPAPLVLQPTLGLQGATEQGRYCV